jgi:hypothetical protein
LDGSTYKGKIPRDNDNFGEYTKRKKGNASYYKNFSGKWFEGGINGEGELQIKK